jgi:hypothetical protein
MGTRARQSLRPVVADRNAFVGQWRRAEDSVESFFLPETRRKPVGLKSL